MLAPAMDLQPNTRSGSDTYFLVPTEGFQSESREIQLPSGLNPYPKLHLRVTNKKKFKKMLLKLLKANITRNKDGFVTDGNNILHGIDYNNAVVDSCNGNFFKSYEEFYCLLRKFGITF